MVRVSSRKVELMLSALKQALSKKVAILTVKRGMGLHVADHATDAAYTFRSIGFCHIPDMTSTCP